MGRHSKVSFYHLTTLKQSFFSISFLSSFGVKKVIFNYYYYYKESAWFTGFLNWIVRERHVRKLSFSVL